MKDLLNSQVKMDDGELADHDFDVVRHTDCNYDDNGKGLQMRLWKIFELDVLIRKKSCYYFPATSATLKTYIIPTF